MGQPFDVNSSNVATAEGPEPEAWSQELSERLYQLLYVREADTALNARIESLLTQFGDAVFSELIFLLSHLRFEPPEAREHWNGILAHRESLAAHLSTAVDLRVALVSYFVHINRQFENPKVIELRLFEQTQASAYRDDLTGLFNYRAFREHLDREVGRAQRHNTPLSLLMIDCDDFKMFNDQRGHDAGNDLLAAVGRVLRRSVRKIDLPARFGGEEFVILLPETYKADAMQVAEIVRSRIEAHRFGGNADMPQGQITVSIGIATSPGDAIHAAELVRCADRAMYAAKARGKNCVSLYGEDRRSFQRLRAEMDGSFRSLDSDPHVFRTIDISEGGMLIRSEAPITEGTVIDSRLALVAERDISALGRVTQSTECDGAYEVRVRFVDMPWEDRVLLAQHLRKAPRS